jgi:hypothetical protein
MDCDYLVVVCHYSRVLLVHHHNSVVDFRIVTCCGLGSTDLGWFQIETVPSTDNKPLNFYYYFTLQFYFFSLANIFFVTCMKVSIECLMMMLDDNEF